MKRHLCIAFLLTGALAAVGCQKQQKTPSDSIRDGIRQHLTSLKTLNLSAMDMNITNVSVNGDTAQALVEYVPKAGAPPGAAMRVSYSLEKRGDQWVVVKTNSLGGAIDHPGPGANPHAQATQGEAHGNLPNFRELIPPPPSDSSAGLPPGHLPVPSSDPARPN
jgi:hypothetical protein